MTNKNLCSRLLPSQESHLCLALELGGGGGALKGGQGSYVSGGVDMGGGWKTDWNGVQKKGLEV